MTQFQRTFPARYGAALLFTVAVLLLKLLLIPLVTHDEPVLLFLAAVILSAAFGGLGPGLLATVLSACFDGFFFMQPFDRLQLNSADEGLRLGIFILEGVFVSVICARMKAARQQAEMSAAETHELEDRLLQISEAEQRRIGHDLHDGLSQHLTGVGMLARRLEENLRSVSPAAAQDASRLLALAKSAVDLTRDLCRSLSPATLESRGLSEALRELGGHVENIFNIDCTVVISGEPPALDVQSRVHFYRIAQEALNNAVRHGQAKHTWLTLNCSSPEMTLEIVDDGVGIKPGEVTHGLGLKIMRYRARKIGARLTVSPRVDGGTIIHCRYNPSGNSSNSGKVWITQQQFRPPAKHVSSSSKTTPSSAKD